MAVPHFRVTWPAAGYRRVAAVVSGSFTLVSVSDYYVTRIALVSFSPVVCSRCTSRACMPAAGNSACWGATDRIATTCDVAIKYPPARVSRACMFIVAFLQTYTHMYTCTHDVRIANIQASYVAGTCFHGGARCPHTLSVVRSCVASVAVSYV